MPNCTIIKTGATVTSTPSERVSELKALIDAIDVPAVPRVAGDAVLYDNVNGKIVFASANADFANNYPASQFSPIGVVVVPNSHNVYVDGKNGVISLRYIDSYNPDEGSEDPESLCWGDNSRLLIKAMNEVVCAGSTLSPTRTATSNGSDYEPMFPSDNFTTVVSPTDSVAYYSISSQYRGAIPSPYLEDGSRNPVYYQTTDPASEANCLSDFDGVGNTQLMLNAVTVSDWQTASTISNSSSSGNYPSACCCWRYHTAGTSQGDWYLPAMGELGYMMARLKTINATISNLIEAYGANIATINAGGDYLSSTEYSASNARNVLASDGCVSYSNKTSSFSVRAFARL